MTNCLIMHFQTRSTKNTCCIKGEERLKRMQQKFTQMHKNSTPKTIKIDVHFFKKGHNMGPFKKAMF